MAVALKEGERVQVVNREATEEDVKSGLFYNYFRGLEGTIQKIFNTQEVSVEVDLEALDPAVMKRHIDIQEQTKSKWLDGLSEEARGRLTDQEKDFKLRYSILVKDGDLAVPGSQSVPERFVIVPQAAPKLASLSAPTITSQPEVQDMGDEPAPQITEPIEIMDIDTSPGTQDTSPSETLELEMEAAPARATLDDIEAAEEAYLQNRTSNGDA